MRVATFHWVSDSTSTPTTPDAARLPTIVRSQAIAVREVAASLLPLVERLRAFGLTSRVASRPVGGLLLHRLSERSPAHVELAAALDKSPRQRASGVRLLGASILPGHL